MAEITLWFDEKFVQAFGEIELWRGLRDGSIIRTDPWGGIGLLWEVKDGLYE